MKIFKIMIIMIILIMSVGAVCAADADSDDLICDDNQDILESVQDDISAVSEPKTFTDLETDISNSTGGFDVDYDYKFNNDSDNNTNGILIAKENFVINGNGRTIDASNQSAIFKIAAKNVTINNLTFINANFARGSVFVIPANCSLTTNNVNFINNTADNKGIITIQGTYSSNGDRFTDCTSGSMGVIYLMDGELNVDNAVMTSSQILDWGFIYTEMPDVNITVSNSIFANTTSRYTTGIRGSTKTIIRNSTFVNLCSEISAGAIAAKSVSEFVVENCSFVNVGSHKNAGAILADVYGDAEYDGNFVIYDSHFINCFSGFGGAIMQLGGNLNLSNCEFINNSAEFDGGAIFMSCVSQAFISNSTFTENSVIYDSKRTSFGGAVYCDFSALSFSGNEIINNSAGCGGALYLYQSNYYISDNKFAGNTNLKGSFDDIFTVFDDFSVLENNIYSGDKSYDLNNTDYASIMNDEGMGLILLNNTIVVAELPSRFDLREWGWVTPIRDQGRAGVCWTFGSSAAMESAILRYLGIEMDISENNIEDVSLTYSHYGVITFTEGGSTQMAAAYALSWLGVFSSEYDSYDQIGKISPMFGLNTSIHFQDVVFIPPINSSSDRDLLKQAILKYGAVAISYCAEQLAPGFNPETSAQYLNESQPSDHCVAVVGWDDSYSASNFLITPPDDGAWIIKNSWGENAGDKGYFYVSYYDATFANQVESIAYVLENTVKYNMNYQYDVEGVLKFIPAGNEYFNEYCALEDDLIAAVGTYFQNTGVEYKVEVYVNGKLKLSQSGFSPFAGFHTIKLNSYVPIKKGDMFKVLIKSESVPMLVGSRQAYIPGSSLAKMDGNWVDVTGNNMICSVKVYTVVDDTKVINNKNIAVDYAGGKYFSVKIVTADGHAVGAGEKVKFTIGGKSTTVTTDSSGIAKIKISNAPGSYKITTTYKGKSVKNTVTVKHVITASKVTVKKTAKKFTLKATLKINGKLVKGKWITFKFNGKTYKVKTNSKGVAQKTLYKKVIKKLKKATYIVKVSYSKDSIKTSIKVK